MSELGTKRADLAVANRILAHEGVMDSLGHISMRNLANPKTFFLSRMKSPEMVMPEDIMELDLDGEPTDKAQQNNKDFPLYNERVLHAAIYKHRPEMNAVSHFHAKEILPFTVTKVKLRAVTHLAASLGEDVPVWDIRDKSGDTDLLVRTMDQAEDMVKSMGPEGQFVLMRGHGGTLAAESLYAAVRNSIYIIHNAQLQLEAMQLGGEITFLTPGEIRIARKMAKVQKNIDRSWGYWTRRADAGKLVA